MAAPDTINVITTQLAASREPDRWDRRTVEKTIPVANVTTGFTNFLEQVQQMLTVNSPTLGEFQLEEVSFAAEVSPDGQFRLVGTGAAEVAGGFRFTLKRKHTMATADLVRLLVGTEPTDTVKDNKFEAQEYVRGEDNGKPVEVHVTGTVPVFENNVPLPVVGI